MMLTDEIMKITITIRMRWIGWDENDNQNWMR